MTIAIPELAPSITRRLATMQVIAAVVAVVAFIYLLVAIVRPDRF